MTLEKYFERLDSCFKKGRGFSIYNCDDSTFEKIVNKFKCSNYHSLIVRTSQLLDTKQPPNFSHSNIECLIILQDLTIENLHYVIDQFMNKLVFPIYYRRKPVFLFSRVDKSEYSLQIESGLGCTPHITFGTLGNVV